MPRTLHELFARRLEDKQWELLVLRGVDLRDLLRKARNEEPDPDLPPLSFGAEDEPILFPEGEDGDLEFALSSGQSLHLLGDVLPDLDDKTAEAIEAYRNPPQPEPEAESKAPES